MKPQVIGGDRRGGVRFAYALDALFFYQDPAGLTRAGCGTTADLARHGIRFLTEDAPPDGASVEMRINWPFLLQGTCRLELVVKGIVTGTTARGTVMRLRSYEFQTCGERSFFESPQLSGKSRVA